MNKTKEFLENRWHFKLYILDRNFHIWYNACERNNALNYNCTHIFTSFYAKYI